MVTEIAEFTVDPARGEDFAAAYRTVRHHLLDAGARTVRLARGVESPGRFVLLAEWDSVADHQAFRGGPTFGDWRAAITPFFAADPHMEHVEVLD